MGLSPAFLTSMDQRLRPSESLIFPLALTTAPANGCAGGSGMGNMSSVGIGRNEP